MTAKKPATTAKKTTAKKPATTAKKQLAWYGYKPTAVARWLGSQGYSVDVTLAVFEALFGPHHGISPTTAVVSTSHGRTGAWGTVPDFPAPAEKELRKIIRKC